jgi:hypothetical protein
MIVFEDDVLLLRERKRRPFSADGGEFVICQFCHGRPVDFKFKRMLAER